MALAASRQSTIFTSTTSCTERNASTTSFVWDGLGSVLVQKSVSIYGITVGY